jgi:hypothetical protein
MYNLMEMSRAEYRVYIVSNCDGTDAEFLPMDHLDAAFAGLSEQWSERNLAGVGVAGLVGGVPVVMLREEPEDFMVVVRLTAAFSRYVVGGCAVPDAETQPHVGDGVAWCEALYALPDSRFEL